MYSDNIGIMNYMKATNKQKIVAYLAAMHDLKRDTLTDNCEYNHGMHDALEAVIKLFMEEVINKWEN